MITIINKHTFRSDSKVNKTDNMIRVTLDMTRKEWMQVKSMIDKEGKE